MKKLVIGGLAAISFVGIVHYTFAQSTHERPQNQPAPITQDLVREKHSPERYLKNRNKTS